MPQPNLLDLAKQGDPDAISHLMNRVLQSRGVTAKAVMQENCLHVLLEADQIPNQSTLVQYVSEGVMGLESEAIQSITVYGRQKGEVEPAWTHVVDLSSEAANAAAGTSAAAGAAALGGAAAVGGAAALGGAAAMSGAAAAGQAGKAAAGSSLTSAARVSGQPLTQTPQSTYMQPDEFNSAAWQGNVAKLLLGALVALIVGLLGFLTWMRFSHQQKLELSQTLVAGAAEADDADDLNTLRSSHKQLKEASNILTGIPDLPGSAYQQAQAELQAIHPRLEAVGNQLNLEENALHNFKAAEQLGMEAATLAQTTPRSAKDLQQSQLKWKQAIGLLAEIPKGTFVSAQALDKLNAYQRNYVAVSQGLTIVESDQRVDSPNAPGNKDISILNLQK